MPRSARKLSNTDVYHIILRGINKQDIFYDDMDRKKFSKVHLLIKDNELNICKILQSLTIRYAIYFNIKHERVGHLFSNRYNSRPVENERYFISLQRYIHQNPEKAGIEKTENYKWSSYNAYINGSNFVNVDFLLNMLSNDYYTAINQFKIMNSKILELDTIDDIHEYEMVNKVADSDIRKIIELKIGKEKLNSLNIYNKKVRDEILFEILQIKGVSNIQLSRVIGINRKLLDRLKK